MEVQPDFEELFVLFNKHRVKYIIVGAYALAFHGAPRTTGDIDVFVQPTAENARRVISALKDFGFGPLNLTESDFAKPKWVVQLGIPPVRIDLVTSITAVTWRKAYSGKVRGAYGKARVHYLGKPEYLINKRAVARKKDLADIEALCGK